MIKYLLFFAVFTSSIDAAPINLQQVMTDQELKDSGMNDASPQEQAALERWISNWTLRVIEQAPTYRPGQDLSLWVQSWPSFANPKSGKLSQEEITERLRHNARIDKVKNDGALLELKDGSIWEISPLYTYLTSAWQKGETVEFEKSRNYLYKFTIRNVNRSEVADCNMKEAPSPTGEKKPESPEYYKGSVPMLNIDNMGEIMQLSDGTSWKIAPVDTFKAKNWHSNDRIRIEKADNFLYHYRLTNLDNGEVVLANKNETKW